MASNLENVDVPSQDRLELHALGAFQAAVKDALLAHYQTFITAFITAFTLSSCGFFKYHQHRVTYIELSLF